MRKEQVVLNAMQWSEIIARYKNGEKVAKMAEEYNVHISTIYNHLPNEAKNYGSKLTNQLIRSIGSDYCFTSLTFKDLSRKYHLSESTINKAIDKYSISHPDCVRRQQVTRMNLAAVRCNNNMTTLQSPIYINKKTDSIVDRFRKYRNLSTITKTSKIKKTILSKILKPNMA